MTLIPPAHTPAAKIATASIISGFADSAREVLVEERDHPVDRAFLHVIDLDRAVGADAG